MRLQSSRGIALISVLWISGLLAVIAASFVSSTRTEARLALNQLENAKAEALADGGVSEAIMRLLDTDPKTAWRGDRTSHLLALGEGEVQIAIEDEDGKIDLNAAPLELLAGLFRALGLEQEAAQTMADRIGDFRDADSEPEPLGAEDQAYFDAGLPEGPADRPFATESELLRVLGMTRELYERIRPYVTVYSGAEGIDPTRAPRIVLEALPGITRPLVEQFLAAQAEPQAGPQFTIADSGLLKLQSYLVPSREITYTVRATARTQGGGNFLREAVIELAGGRGQPFLVHAWRRGLMLSKAG
jgi:general secretion pathway protein K